MNPKSSILEHESSNNRQSITVTREIVAQIFEFWKETLNHPKARIDDKRKNAITQALKLGYTEAELKQAIVGCSKTPFNMGENDRKEVYDGIGLIFRDAERIDRFIRNAQAGENQKQCNDKRPSRKVLG